MHEQITEMILLLELFVVKPGVSPAFGIGANTVSVRSRPSSPTIIRDPMEGTATTPARTLFGDEGANG